MQVILRHNDTICVYEYGYLYALYADGTRVRINNKLDIFPLAPTKHIGKKRGRGVRRAR